MKHKKAFETKEKIGVKSDPRGKKLQIKEGRIVS